MVNRIESSHKKSSQTSETSPLPPNVIVEALPPSSTEGIHLIPGINFFVPEFSAALKQKLETPQPEGHGICKRNNI